MFYMVEGGGFEPPKSSDDRFTVCSLWPLGNPSSAGVTVCLYGAGDGTRTRNLLITSQLLYQLSYASPTRQSMELGLLQKSAENVNYFFIAHPITITLKQNAEQEPPESF